MSKQQEKKPRSKKTKDQYKTYIDKYMTESYPYKDPKLMYDYLKKEKKKNGSLYKQSTVRIIMYAISSQFEDDNNIQLYEKYNKFNNDVVLPEYKKEEQEIYENKTDNKTKDEYKELYNKYKSTYSKSRNLSKRRYFAVASLYILIVPRRALDYTMMKLVEKPEDIKNTENNYYVLSENKFIFNVYKTASTYNTQIVLIPDELKNILTKYISDNHIKFGDLMFKDYSFIHRALKDVFGNSVNYLRHAEVDDQFKGFDREEIIKKAEAMSHSLGVHIKYITHENKKYNKTTISSIDE